MLLVGGAVVAAIALVALFVSSRGPQVIDEAPGSNEIIELSPPSEVNGFIESYGEVDRYSFEVSGGSVVAIEMTSVIPDEVDTVLQVQALGGTFFDSNDDFGDSTNSRVSFVAPFSGTYMIDALTYSECCIGPYFLRVTVDE